MPYIKLSKKNKGVIDRSKRSTWGVSNGVTRVAKSKKIYNRKDFKAVKGD